MKKLFVFLAMVAGAGFIFASEQDGNYDCHKVGQLYYNLRWSGVGGTAEVTIPDDHWISHPYKDIKDLVIPDFVQDVYNSHSYSVQGIAGRTFYDCSWFTSVSLPSGVMSYIGDKAFYGCTGLSSFTFPAGLTSIGEGAFTGCTGLKSVTINSVTTIGNRAFEDCTGFTSFSIPECVTSLGANVFAGCSNISAFTVDINNPVYTGDEGIIYTRGKTAILAYPGAKSGAYHMPHTVQNIAAGTFSKNTNLTEVSIGNGVTNIGKEAFYNCTGLAYVSLGNHVTTIGESAFYNCNALPSIVIPNSVTTIGMSAFSFCSGMDSVIIGANVESIERMAFFGCSNLSAIVCRATTPPALGEMVFGGLPSSGYEGLDPKTCVLYVPKGSESLYESASQWSDFTHIVGLDELVPVSDYAIPLEAQRITVLAAQESQGVSSEDYKNLLNGDKSDKWCRFKSGGGAYSTRDKDILVWKTAKPVKMASYTLTTGNDTRRYPARNWKAWTLYGGTFADDDAATAALTTDEGWTVLHKVTNDVVLEPQDTTDFRFACRTPGTYQYYRLVIDDIVGPDNIQQMAELTMGIDPEGGNPNPAYYAHVEIDGIWYNLSDEDHTAEVTHRAESYGAYDGNVVIPESVTYNDVIYHVTKIGDSAFDTCHDLISVTMPNSIDSIKADAFMACFNLTNVTMGNGVKSIGHRAFEQCRNLKTIDIPNTVTFIDEMAFLGCGGLTAINVIDVGATNGHYNSEDGVLFNKDKTSLLLYPQSKQGDYTVPNSVIRIEESAFTGRAGLTSVNMGDHVTYIGRSAFEGCTNMRSIRFKNSVPTIGIYAFYKCTGLTSVKIPYGVTSIGGWAFDQCSALQSVSIPSTVSSIENSAFWYCTALTSITNYATTPQTIDFSVFDLVDKSACTLYVPAESIDAYRAAEYWSAFEHIVAIDDTQETIEADYTVWYEGKDHDVLSNQMITLYKPIAPQIAGFTFLRWEVVGGNLEDGIVIQAVYKSNTPTNSPEVYSNPANPAQKLIRNGNVYILRDGKTYTVTGQQVK